MRHQSLNLFLPLFFVLIWNFSALALVGNAPPASGYAARAIVMVVDPRGDLCTGTALTRDLVLTAAHCVARKLDYQVKTFQTGQTISVRAIASHPRFDYASYAASRATADVALHQACRPARRSGDAGQARARAPRRRGRAAHHRRLRRHRRRHRSRLKDSAHGHARRHRQARLACKFGCTIRRRVIRALASAPAPAIQARPPSSQRAKR